ncbi:hypothetical protein HZC31_07470 [Candidatus Woesearchaeota archaeon]|nr:hypothetical protein [Candidatus Woesearchaeota archaeon]
MAKEKTNLYLLSIVAIVAIVGIVVLVLNSGAGSVSLSDSDLSGEAVGTKKLVRASDCPVGKEWNAATGECVSVFKDVDTATIAKTGTSAAGCTPENCKSPSFCFEGECIDEVIIGNPPQ